MLMLMQYEPSKDHAVISSCLKMILGVKKVK